MRVSLQKKLEDKEKSGLEPLNFKPGLRRSMFQSNIVSFALTTFVFAPWNLQIRDADPPEAAALLQKLTISAWHEPKFSSLIAICLCLPSQNFCTLDTPLEYLSFKYRTSKAPWRFPCWSLRSAHCAIDVSSAWTFCAFTFKVTDCISSCNLRVTKVWNNRAWFPLSSTWFLQSTPKVICCQDQVALLLPSHWPDLPAKRSIWKHWHGRISWDGKNCQSRETSGQTKIAPDVDIWKGHCGSCWVSPIGAAAQLKRECPPSLRPCVWIGTSNTS